jgi:hypothetical protein
MLPHDRRTFRRNIGAKSAPIFLGTPKGIGASAQPKTIVARSAHLHHWMLPWPGGLASRPATPWPVRGLRPDRFRASEYDRFATMIGTLQGVPLQA